MRILNFVRISSDVMSKKFNSSQKDAFFKSYFLVNIFYVFVFYEICRLLGLWSRWLEIESIMPLWPVFWINLISLKYAVNILFSFTLISTFFCFLFPYKRLLRILVFISLLEFYAFLNSFGKVGHSFHILIYFSFVFIFLPEGKKDELENSIKKRQTYLNTIFASQILFMLTYSLSGLWKVLYGLEQFIEGDINAFSPYALALLIYSSLQQTNSQSILGIVITDYPLLGWPLYISTIYIELFSVVAVCKPSIHRLWGISLIIFHIFTFLTMKIHFPRNIFLLTLFFVYSPFRLKDYELKQMIRDLPLVKSLIEITYESYRKYQFSKQFF